MSGKIDPEIREALYEVIAGFEPSPIEGVSAPKEPLLLAEVPGLEEDGWYEIEDLVKELPSLLHFDWDGEAPGYGGYVAISAFTLPSGQTVFISDSDDEGIYLIAASGESSNGVNRRVLASILSTNGESLDISLLGGLPQEISVDLPSDELVPLLIKAFDRAGGDIWYDLADAVEGKFLGDLPEESGAADWRKTALLTRYLGLQNRAGRSSADDGDDEAGRSREYTFGARPLEGLRLRVWDVPSANGLLRSRLAGVSRVRCDFDREHDVEIEIESATAATNDDASRYVAALDGDDDVARVVAEELLEYVLEDWPDPCEDDEIDDDA